MTSADADCKLAVHKLGGNKDRHTQPLMSQHLNLEKILTCWLQPPLITTFVWNLVWDPTDRELNCTALPAVMGQKITPGPELPPSVF